MTDSSHLPDGPVLVWFRQDLRTDDNAALAAAAETGREVVCVYILETPAAEHLAIGGAQQWWLHHSLMALSDDLQQRGAQLILRQGEPDAVLANLIEQTGAGAVFWNRRYAPAQIKRDTRLKSDLSQRGLDVRSFDGHLMHEPTQVKTKTGGFFKVYTPFWRAFEAEADQMVREPIPAPQSLRHYDGLLPTDTLDDWHLLPTKPDWSGGIADTWTPGSAGALARLEAFLDGPVQDYGDGRDIPGSEGTSRLSPHLAFGEITPHQIWHEALRRGDRSPSRTTFLKELVWREFSYHLLVNVEDLAHDNYNTQFDAFAWHDAPEALQAWQRGQTGYPIVDAGMRQLWQTGWMHNRVRMIVGSFLVKHLLIDWRQGERWFWDTLVDADPASNAASWQWVAGSGADAAPYFRVFNPILQGEKFDPDGTYVKRYVPELAKLDAKYIHKPWDAPRKVLDFAGVTLGSTYPKPIVDHAAARARALDAYQSMRGQAA